MATALTSHKQQLEQVRYAVNQRLSSSQLAAVNTHLAVDFMAGELVCRLEAGIFGSKLSTYEKAVEVPKTWWDHFKVWWAIECKYRWARKLFQFFRKRDWVAPPEHEKIVFSAEGRLLFPDILPATRQQFRSIEVVHLDVNRF